MGAFIGLGTRLFRKVNGDWVPLSRLVSITGPGVSRDMIDSTTFDTSERFREFITGLRDGGNLSFEAEYTRATYDAMLDDFMENDPVEYMLLIAGDGTGLTFKGFVTDFPLNIPIADKTTLSSTIKVTGKVSVIENGPYLVKYHDNGATEGSVPMAQIKEHGVTLELHGNDGNLEKDGFTFEGWNTQADGEGTFYAEEADYTANADVLLYAKWEEEI